MDIGLYSLHGREVIPTEHIARRISPQLDECNIIAQSRESYRDVAKQLAGYLLDMDEKACTLRPAIVSHEFSSLLGAPLTSLRETANFLQHQGISAQVVSKVHIFKK